MSDVEKAAAGFSQGLNCAQSMLATYGPRFGLERELALKVASGFGGGIGHLGESCGAVTGALMVIGLKQGGTSVDDRDSSEKTYGLVNEFVKRFKARNGSILCRELLGCDISTPQGLENARNKGLFEERCPNFVRASAEILEELLS
jgi:C_GCAxxG_C_C family probable redox protein